MDIHVLVDPELTVRQGHDIATAVEDSVRRVDPNVVGVVVHIEPDESAGPAAPGAAVAAGEADRQPARPVS